VLRAIGDPALRFAEDKLRMLRAVRFATRFELKVDPRPWTRIRAMALEITVVSAERIADELRKLLVSPHRARGLRLLDDVGLAAVLFAGGSAMKNLPQGLPSAPTGNLWEHTLRVLELLGPRRRSRWRSPRCCTISASRRVVGRTPDRYTF